MSEKEQLTKFLAEEAKKEQDKTKSVLDMLRKTRAARGGTGAPLQVPAHLKDAAQGVGVVITDADLTPPPDAFGPSRRR